MRSAPIPLKLYDYRLRELRKYRLDVLLRLSKFFALYYTKRRHGLKERFKVISIMHPNLGLFLPKPRSKGFLILCYLVTIFYILWISLLVLDHRNDILEPCTFCLKNSLLEKVCFSPPSVYILAFLI